TESIEIGASICCSGCCLTVIEMGQDWFAVQVSGESLAKTVLGRWSVGTRVNLERALKMGDELGGHLVSGHIDGVGEVVSVTEDGESRRISFKAPDPLKRFIAEKGSITVDGVSLTVNDVRDAQFDVNVIPHTQQVTTLGTLDAGDNVNLEIDMLSRYVARQLEK
ncbi:MAG: riboflavin synthase, partial [Rhodospirillales bacterium]|nr:riboflavin synthase [Rhodospirillales bacterium]